MTQTMPHRISVPTAARMLDIKLDAVRRMLKKGTFTRLAPNGVGRGKRLYLIPAEVEAYALHGAAGVAKVRAAAKGRKS